MHGAYEKACPIQRQGNHAKMPWWNSNLTKLRKKSRKLRRIAVSTKTPESWESYNKVRNKFKSDIHKAKRDSWRNFCSSMEGMTPVARLLRVLKSDKSTQLGMLRKDDGTYTDTPEDALDLLHGKHFPPSAVPVNEELFADMNIVDISDQIFTTEKI